MKTLVTTLFLLLVFGINATLFAVVIQNRLCLPHPAGSPAGGTQCTSLYCYEETGVAFKRTGTPYSKCSNVEASGSCNQGTGSPICSYLYRYNSLDECLTNPSSGSTSRTFTSDYLTCQ
jgi:hypothetical protein